MSLAIAYSRASYGVTAPQVTIEVHISHGLPHLSIVGLPEAAVKESKDRVRSALLNTSFEFPPRRITINLAPADLPKRDGGRFDLAIALGILSASEQISADKLLEYEFAGELALSGELRPVNAILPFALVTKETKRTLVLPIANAEEAALVSDLKVTPATHILDVTNHILGTSPLDIYQAKKKLISNPNALDLSDIHGQHNAKRALEIAAAGEHGLLMTELLTSTTNIIDSHGEKFL